MVSLIPDTPLPGVAADEDAFYRDGEVITVKRSAQRHMAMLPVTTGGVTTVRLEMGNKEVPLKY